MTHSLRKDSLSFFESLTLGVAGSGPANAISLAMGGLITTAALRSPLYVLIFAVPMLGIALAYKALNRHVTHAGAAFNWVSLTFGKFFGFMSGWALITAQMIFIISGVVPLSTAVLDFINPALANNVAITTGLSVAWFFAIVGVIMFGIKTTSYAQIFMVAFEMLVLLFVGLAAVIHSHGAMPANPFTMADYSPSFFFHTASMPEFSAAALIVIFLYWGWDVTANLGEETANGAHAAGNGGLSGVFVTIFLYSLFAIVTLLLLSAADTGNDSSNLLYNIALSAGLGRVGGLVVSVAVIFSSAATVQTGMLQVTRTLFAMGRDGALPAAFGHVSPRTQNPSTATWWLIGSGLVGILLTGFMPSVSAILSDAVTASGLQVAFYFGMAGLACAWVHRTAYRTSWGHFLLYGVYPFVSAISLMTVGLYAISTFNLTTALVGIGTLVAGVAFFRPRRYVVEGELIPQK
ncbi:APC family permease [Acidocella sp.]|uniref:APC family permease n=1 Tax=Acidocella sp. TaxID=50710 RepID=UPI00261A0E3B|nr:APC family permease [Acidocella sp.]